MKNNKNKSDPRWLPSGTADVAKTKETEEVLAIDIYHIYQIYTIYDQKAIKTSTPGDYRGTPVFQALKVKFLCQLYQRL